MDLGFDIVDSVGGLDLEGDCLSSEGLYEDLHVVVDVGGWDEVAVVAATRSLA